MRDISMVVMFVRLMVMIFFYLCLGEGDHYNLSRELKLSFPLISILYLFPRVLWDLLTWFLEDLTSSQEGDWDHLPLEPWLSSLLTGILWPYNGCLFFDGDNLDSLLLEPLLPSLLDVCLESCELPLSPGARDNLPRGLIPSPLFWDSFELRVGDGNNLPRTQLM